MPNNDAPSKEEKVDRYIRRFSAQGFVGSLVEFDRLVREEAMPEDLRLRIISENDQETREKVFSALQEIYSGGGESAFWRGVTCGFFMGAMAVTGDAKARKSYGGSRPKHNKKGPVRCAVANWIVDVRERGGKQKPDRSLLRTEVEATCNGSRLALYKCFAREGITIYGREPGNSLVVKAKIGDIVDTITWNAIASALWAETNPRQ